MLLGVREFESALRKVAAQADLAARRNVAEAAALLEKTAKANFEGHHKKGQPHEGGDKPNVVSGTLRRSIHHTPIARLGFANYGTDVGPSTVYARSVELGNHPGWAAYPYFEPAYDELRGQYGAIAARNWGRFMLGR